MSPPLYSNSGAKVQNKYVMHKDLTILFSATIKIMQHIGHLSLYINLQIKQLQALTNIYIGFIQKKFDW